MIKFHLEVVMLEHVICITQLSELCKYYFGADLVVSIIKCDSS